MLKINHNFPEPKLNSFVPPAVQNPRTPHLTKKTFKKPEPTTVLRFLLEKRLPNDWHAAEG